LHRRLTDPIAGSGYVRDADRRVGGHLRIKPISSLIGFLFEIISFEFSWTDHHHAILSFPPFFIFHISSKESELIIKQMPLSGQMQEVSIPVGPHWPTYSF